MRRFWFIGLAAFLVPVSLSVLVLQNCKNRKSRGIGQSDVRLDISPAGTKLLFNALGEGGSDLYELDLPTMRVTQVAATPEYEVDARYSPDGRFIVYAAGTAGDPADHLFIRDTHGGPARQLTSADADDCRPGFSNDGSLIVFTRNKEHNWGGLAGNAWTDGVICVIGSDGTDERQLTNDGVWAYQGAFSADDTSIVFDRESGRYSIPVDHSKPATRLPNLPKRDAVYSPDKTLVAYTRGRYSPDLALYVAAPDGTHQHNLTPTTRGCYHPRFLPDGKRLLFLREEWPDGSFGVPKFSLWEVRVDGKSLRMVADYGLFDDPLTWRPKARR